MQRLSSSSVFPKLPKLPANTRLWKCQTREMRQRRSRYGWGWPLRKNIAPFQISSLLLDLDAENARGVRPFEHRDGRIENRYTVQDRALQPLRERVDQFNKAYQKTHHRVKLLAANNLHPYRIRDFDVMLAALIGPFNTVNSLGKGSMDDLPTSYVAALKTLSSVLDSNGVPESARESMSETLRYMQHRRKLYNPAECRDKESLRNTLKTCSSFHELERIVTGVSETCDGCQMLSVSGRELASGLAQLVKIDPFQTLSFLNNLLINLDRYELRISEDIYKLGLLISLKCHAFAVSQQYLRRLFERGQPDYRYVEYLLEHIRYELVTEPADTHAYRLDRSTRLTSLYSLLTGYVPGVNTPAFSFRSLVSRDRPDGFQLYIQCLARLGAFRTIWHEMHTTYAGTRAVGTEQLSMSQLNRALIKPIFDAIITTVGIKVIAEMPVFHHATGQFLEDCQRDLVAISACTYMLSKRSRRLGIFFIDETRLYNIFNTESVTEALRALQKFILDETYRRPEPLQPKPLHAPDKGPEPC